MGIEIILSVGLLLLVAKILGEVTERIGITPLIGQLFAGIVLGPVLGLVVVNGLLTDFIDLGIVFILFLAGLNIKFEDIKENVYDASILTLGGSLLSFVLGFAVGYIFFQDLLLSIAIGVILIATGNDVILNILGRMGEFRTRVGKMIISMNTADDIIGILALSFFTFFIVHGSIALGELFKLFLVAIGFYLIILSVGTKVIDKILNYTGNMIDEQILFAIPIAIVFLLAVLSDNIGLGIATGAFLGGMSMAKNKFTDDIIKPKVKVMSDGFIIPLFYAIVGTLVVFTGLNIMLIIAITAAAVFGKYIGTAAITNFFHFRSDDRQLISIASIPRSDYNIAVTQIALSLGVFAGFATLYSSIIFSIILTIIVTPLLMRFVLKRRI